jgi:hypothetical protein
MATKEKENREGNRWGQGTEAWNLTTARKFDVSETCIREWRRKQRKRYVSTKQLTLHKQNVKSAQVEK